MGEDIHNHLENTYWGPGYSNDEIYDALKNCKLSFMESNDPADEAARLLEEGQIIGWFQGRMEVGPRALGNRSILANPVLPTIKDKVNTEVKYREAWRPFCPSLVGEVKENYIRQPNEASFMIVAYYIQEAMWNQIPSVVHVDGTIRPQVVTKVINPLYYTLLMNLGKRTGHPIVLNTSLNVRGEPIIRTPLEAVRCFYSNGLDAMVIGNFILKKRF
jgi:carbamoyltransferase